MVEVFKTNVEIRDHAEILIQEIHRSFTEYKANFDLDDCDKILRIESSAFVEPVDIIHLLKYYGFSAEVLPDEPLPFTEISEIPKGDYCFLKTPNINA